MDDLWYESTFASVVKKATLVGAIAEENDDDFANNAIEINEQKDVGQHLLHWISRGRVDRVTELMNALSSGAVVAGLLAIAIYVRDNVLDHNKKECVRCVVDLFDCPPDPEFGYLARHVLEKAMSLWEDGT